MKISSLHNNLTLITVFITLFINHIKTVEDESDDQIIKTEVKMIQMVFKNRSSSFIF
jgi:hypothetical protein